MTPFEKFYQAFFEADRYLLYLDGVGVTLKITICSLLLGTVIGIFLALMKLSDFKVLFFRPFKLISTVYIDVIRGTPTVVQILFMYMVILSAPDTSKLFVAIMTFAVNSSAYIAEIVRAGIMAVDQGQMEAGRSLGLSKTQAMGRIILPQAVKNILPAYTNEVVTLIKETAIVGYIALEDLTKVSSIVISRTYEAMYPLLIIAVIYFILTKSISYLSAALERRFAKSDRG